MIQTVLPQLEEIILDLTAQETVVKAQLAEIQLKLEAVQAVIPLFKKSSSVDSEKSTSQKLISDTKDSVTQKEIVSKSVSTTENSKKKSASRSAKPKTAQRTASKKKKVDGRTATWQKYTRAKVADQGIPDVVKLILSTQPEKNFTIAEVMSSIFEDDMPKTYYLKARNRISNILSGGVRDGEWFKGDRGTYRLAKTDS